MKLAPSRQLNVPALSCAFLITLVVGAAACGDEAAIPPGGTGGTGTTAGSGTVVPMAGSAGTAVTTAGSSSAGTSSAGTSAGGTSSAGTSAGGTSSAGTSSAGTSAGGTSSAGTSAGGTSSAGTSAGGTSGGDLKETVAGPLNGAMLLGPCVNKTAESVCQTNKSGTACPGANADAALSGYLSTDKTITLGGDPTKVYTITLHVQGEVESKKYDGGMDKSSVGASPKADGFCEGGTPSNGDAYNVYMARVTSPKKDYFFNSIQPPGVSNHTTYGIDYTASIKANGGTTIRLVAADKNCSMIRNCGPQENSGNVCSAPITLQGIDPVATSKNPSFDFTKAYDGQWVVMVVTDVTAG